MLPDKKRAKHAADAEDRPSSGAAHGPAPVWPRAPSMAEGAMTQKVYVQPFPSRGPPNMTAGAFAAVAYGAEGGPQPPLYRTLKDEGNGKPAAEGKGEAVATPPAAASAFAKPTFRALPKMTPGLMAALTYGSAVAPRVYTAAFEQNEFQQQGAAAAASSSSSSSAEKKALGQAAQQQPQLLSHAPPLPLVHQRSAKHCVVEGTDLAEVSQQLVAVAEAQGAVIKINATRATIKLTKLAPPTAPDGGCEAVVFKVRVFALDAGQRRYLLDFTHRKGSRVVACELYRSVVARLRRTNCIRTPAHDHLLDDGGFAKKCKVYTVPSFRRAQAGGPGAGPAAVEPAVAAATVAPLLAAAASPCFDQQLASCQLLAKLTASKRAARAAAGAGAMDVDGGEVDDDSNEHMASAIVGAMFGRASEHLVVALFGCLADRKDDEPAVFRPIAPAAEDGGAEDPLPRALPLRVHETVRRCIVSTAANMALQQRDGGAALRALLVKAGALDAVRRALPDGGDEVHEASYSSEQAKCALVRVVNGGQ
jgi:hypothetical protein